MRGSRALWIALVAACALALLACSSGSDGAGGTTGDTAGTGAAAATGDPANDKLAQILARGTLVLSTDTEYPPQSFAVESEQRPPDTACAENQLTANQVSGYDAETGKLVAGELGVEACFVTPTYTEVTSGGWGDRWDISFSSGCMSEERMDRLWMTQPYYSNPSQYFVQMDAPYQAPSDLDGKRIGACAGCSDEFFLRGTLELPGVELTPDVQDPEIVLYDVEPPGLKQLAKGHIDAFLCSTEVGREAIRDGLPLREMQPVAYSCFPSGFVDKRSGLSSAAFVARVDEIIQAAHADGTLRALSMEFWGSDYSTDAASFDLASIGQEVT
jgi:ABC-type amino acid transport substrate-binding protein